jgi:hypothetical protein
MDLFSSFARVGNPGQKHFIRTSGDQRKRYHVLGWLKTNGENFRSIVLLAVLDKAITLGGQGNSMLVFVHEFLESRVKLVKSVKVSLCMFWWIA